jgi:hypothetical protein
MTEERRKPLDVALAESRAWRQGLQTARIMKQTHLDERVLLLKLGWPSGHALCEELDRGAGKWAGIEDQMRRDYIQHAQEHYIDISGLHAPQQLPLPTGETKTRLSTT